MSKIEPIDFYLEDLDTEFVIQYIKLKPSPTLQNGEWHIKYDIVSKYCFGTVTINKPVLFFCINTGEANIVKKYEKSVYYKNIRDKYILVQRDTFFNNYHKK